MLKIVYRGFSISIAILLCVSVLAISSQTGNPTGSQRDALKLKSVVLLKRQCELAVKDFTESIEPYYSEWRSEHSEPLSRLENPETFSQQQRLIERRFEQLSERAKTGVVKDCETLLRQFYRRYAK